VAGQGARVRLSQGQLPLDRGPVALSAGDVRSSLGDAMGITSDAKPIFSAPAAWSVLLLGLVGLFVMMPRPGVERVRTWAMAIPSRAAARLGTRAGALDPIDPDGYAQAPGRSHQGHFVRAAARGRFGTRI
jgi:hypothetical protein